MLAIAIGLPYACAPLYRFPDPVPFAGSAFLNPYAGLRGTWQRTNLHAHSRRWGGLTNGHQTAAEVVRTYRALGYSVAGVSDYHAISPEDGVETMPPVLHGSNVIKRHQLAIGAHRVDWFDFPLWQSLSNRQFVIDRVGRTADLVALNHPPSRDGYTPDDLRLLTGYQLLEVVNGPHRAEEPWDAALSSGHAVWALANDDTHDLTDPDRTGMAWTMIDAPSPSTRDIVDALRAGRMYAVSRRGEIPAGVQTSLTGFDFTDGTLLVTYGGPPATFDFVGQNGIVRKSVRDATSASYTFTADDTYVRTAIHAPNATLYLNPVLRYDGLHFPAPVASLNTVGTWLQRAALLIAFVALGLLYRKRRSRATSAPPALLAKDERTTAGTAAPARRPAREIVPGRENERRCARLKPERPLDLRVRHGPHALTVETPLVHVLSRLDEANAGFRQQGLQSGI